MNVFTYLLLKKRLLCFIEFMGYRVKLALILIAYSLFLALFFCAEIIQCKCSPEDGINAIIDSSR